MCVMYACMHMYVCMARDTLVWIYVETRGWLQVPSLILSTILLNWPLQGWPCTGKPGWEICIQSSTLVYTRLNRPYGDRPGMSCSTVPQVGSVGPLRPLGARPVKLQLPLTQMAFKCLVRPRGGRLVKMHPHLSRLTSPEQNLLPWLGLVSQDRP